jgi:chromosome segregation protein
MPEDNEKVEDFISLWRKKMETDIKKPSAIGETIERIKGVEEENEELRNKIKENIELISKTELIIKNIIDENEKLKEQLKNIEMPSSVNVGNIQKDNIELNNRILQLEKNLTEKEVELRARNHELTDLKTKLEVASRTPQSINSSSVEPNSEVTTALIENLKSELSKKKSYIDELEKNKNELTEENEALNEQLIEKMKKLPIDYVVPVESPKSSVIKPQITQPSSQTLEILCQDLQSDLNKYKKIVEKLNQEKTELEQTIETGGFELEPDEIKELKKENEELKNALSEIQVSLQKKSQEVAQNPQINEFKNQISEFQSQLNEKDRLIAELKTMEKPQSIVHTGPMSDLVEDLQNKINKLKIALDEKNKIIEQIKPP